MRVIMLGKLRSGKSTVMGLVREFTQNEIGMTLNPKPLAAPIYAESRAFYEKFGLVWRKNRKLMEGIGEAMNEDYPKGDLIVELYRETFNPSENIIVEDARRLTQANFFAQSEGKTLFIRVYADDAVRKARCKPGEWSEGHVTDTELDTYPADYTIVNNDDNMERLRADVLNVVLQIKEKL